MAFSLAHPAATLLLKPLCKRGWLHFPALLIGSVTPDLGYLTGAMVFSDTAHQPLGAITHALPLALVFVAVLYLLRVPILFTFPAPFRQFLSYCPSLQKAPNSSKAMFAVLLSCVLGIATHLLWDSFTQADGWLVAQARGLRKPVALGEGIPLPPFVMLYHLTTFLGVAGLIIFAGRWTNARLFLWRRHPRHQESWRWYFWGLAIFVPLAYAVAANWSRTRGDAEWLRWKTFAQGSLVDFVFMFGAILLTASLVVYAVHRSRFDPEEEERHG